MTTPPRTMPEIVDNLRVALGAKLVAYIAGVSETRTVREWAEATRRPTPDVEDRLRLAHRIVTLIGQSEGEAIVPTWFQGMNPHLGNRSPARVLHEDSFDEASARVLAAANAFVVATDRQQSAVERVISRRFEPDQINAPTVTPTSFPATSGDPRRARDTESKFLPVIEDLEIAHLVRERSTAGDATPLADVAASLGLNPDSYR